MTKRRLPCGHKNAFSPNVQLFGRRLDAHDYSLYICQFVGECRQLIHLLTWNMAESFANNFVIEIVIDKRKNCATPSELESSYSITSSA
jgi:hypothetical protein